MKFNVEVLNSDDSQTLENATREDITSFLKLVIPDLVSSLDWEKLECGDIIELNKGIIITAVKEAQEPS